MTSAASAFKLRDPLLARPGSGFADDDAALIGGLEPPTDAESRWWWERCAPLLATLLRNCGSYSAQQQLEHMRVFRDLVVPTFGPRTAKARVTPLLTMDGSPFEPSWNFQEGGSIVRYTFEPLWDDAGTPENPFPGARLASLMPVVRAVVKDADLRWFDQACSEWLVTGDEVARAQAALAKAPHGRTRVPQIFLAFDMKGGDRMLKSYHFPVLKHLATGISTVDLTFSLINKLEPGADRLRPGAERVRRYLTTHHKTEPAPRAEMIAIDCVDPSRARVKIYARSSAQGGNAMAVVRDAFTLGGQQTDEATLAGIEHIGRFWHLALDERAGLASDDAAKPPRDPHDHHVGICFVFEIRQGEEHVDVKAHLPWCQTNGSDLRGVQNFAEMLRTLGWEDHATRYELGGMETAKLPGRDYANQAGGLSYMAYNYNKNGGDYISSYFSPMPQANHSR